LLLPFGCGENPPTAQAPKKPLVSDAGKSNSQIEAGATHNTVRADTDESDLRRLSNQPLLDEVAAAGLWFHARKTRPIWVRKLESPQRIKTLEGEEEVPAGTFLCRGEAGDFWPQTPERLESKYEATDEASDDGWRKYVPRPDNEGVLAAQIGHSFQVEAAWGTLTGKPGDYVVKNYSDQDVASPADVWIVDQGLFQATYQSVSPGARESAGPG
jgi:hypothetical protein